MPAGYHSAGRRFLGCVFLAFLRAEKKSNGTHPESRVWAWAGSDCRPCMDKNSYSCI